MNRITESNRGEASDRNSRGTSIVVSHWSFLSRLVFAIIVLLFRAFLLAFIQKHFIGSSTSSQVTHKRFILVAHIHTMVLRPPSSRIMYTEQRKMERMEGNSPSEPFPELFSEEPRGESGRGRSTQEGRGEEKGSKRN